MPAIIKPTISISLCTPPIRWMITNGLSTQIHSAAAPLAPTWRATRGAAQISSTSPGSMHSRSTIVPAITWSPTSIVTNLATRMNAGPVRRGRRRPDRTHVVQQRVRIVDRADDVRVEAVAQQCALRQIGVGVAAEHRHARAAAAPARSRWSPPSCTRVAEPSITRRPSHSHANSITATPPHSSTDDSTRPWPKRSQDRCSDSSSGSCSRVLPAPRPPTVISTAPRTAEQCGPGLRRRGERGQPRTCRASRISGRASTSG